MSRIKDEERLMEKADKAFGLAVPDHVQGYDSSSVLRLDFQLQSAAQTKGIVLNLGANEDPAGLQRQFGERIVNCDLHAVDYGMGNRPNLVDRLIDITKPEDWAQFPDDYAELALFGDVLEHLPYEMIVVALTEAKRVASKLSITVPEDWRVDPQATYADGTYNLHITTVTEGLLRKALNEAGWTPYLFVQMDWQCGGDAQGMLGWGVEAHRSV